MIWWSDGVWGSGWWLAIVLMGALMVVCMVMMARMMSHAVPCFRAGRSQRRGPDVPERILAQRLASGEIDIDEYQRLRDALARDAVAGQLRAGEETMQARSH